ncbi:MAG TPA: prepilin-type N-terminal cleavage/methylation domain-containing protein [Candidatus Elarobacter sp.]|jgi:prepilin-type N-terminal cleavage/methylation domain-containing protein
MRTGERGFTLLELVLCVAIIASAAAAALGACAAIARNASPGAARDVALMVAENALARARAAVAYVGSPVQDGPALLADRSWALAPGSSSYVAGARLRGAAPCGANGAADLRLPVTTAYDAANERFTVVVRYPRDPCRALAAGAIEGTNAATVALAETLPPSVYPPGQAVHRDIAPPVRM